MNTHILAVSGAVSADNIRFVLPNEHLFWDISHLHTSPPLSLTIENLAEIHEEPRRCKSFDVYFIELLLIFLWNVSRCLENLRLDAAVSLAQNKQHNFSRKASRDRSTL